MQKALELIRLLCRAGTRYPGKGQPRGNGPQLLKLREAAVFLRNLAVQMSRLAFQPRLNQSRLITLAVLAAHPRAR
ncbi:hypothetical protein D9M70_631460 [compost metagenome]